MVRRCKVNKLFYQTFLHHQWIVDYSKMCENLFIYVNIIGNGCLSWYWFLNNYVCGLSGLHYSKPFFVSVGPLMEVV